MLSNRPSQRPTNQGVNSRMKPARQTRSMRCALKRCLQRALEGFAVLAECRVVDDRGRDSLGACARASPAASGRLESTSAISAG